MEGIKFILNRLNYSYVALRASQWSFQKSVIMFHLKGVTENPNSLIREDNCIMLFIFSLFAVELNHENLPTHSQVSNVDTPMSDICQGIMHRSLGW